MNEASEIHWMRSNTLCRYTLAYQTRQRNWDLSFRNLGYENVLCPLKHMKRLEAFGFGSMSVVLTACLIHLL